MRITAACPEALMPDANQLAMALGESVADAETYRNPSWQDADGNLYAAASFEARDEWIAAAQQPLQRPAWDTEGIIDMDAAARAQAALVFTTDATPAQPDRLTAIGGMEGLDALAAMGLTAKAEEAGP
jgi:hypothetical protein